MNICIKYIVLAGLLGLLSACVASGHNLAYIKDERTLKFLYPTNTGDWERDQNNFKKQQEIRKLHQNLWGQFGPRKETFILQPHRKGK